MNPIRDPLVAGMLAISALCALAMYGGHHAALTQKSTVLAARAAAAPMLAQANASAAIRR